MRVYALRSGRVWPVSQLGGGRRSRQSNKSPARLSPQPVSLMSDAAVSATTSRALCCSASAAAWVANVLRNSSDSACALRAMSAHCVVSCLAAVRSDCSFLILPTCRPECEGGRHGRFLTLHTGRFCTFGMLCWLVAVFGLEPCHGSGHHYCEKQAWLPDQQNWNPKSYQTNKTGIPNPTIVAPKDVSQHNGTLLKHVGVQSTYGAECVAAEATVLWPPDEVCA